MTLAPGAPRAGIRGAYVVMLFALSACAAPSAAPRADVTFAPDSGGLEVVGTGLRIDFGRSPSGVIAAMDRELGRGRDLGVETCTAGVVTQKAWGDLVLSFTSERFVGWRNGQARAGQVCG